MTTALYPGPSERGRDRERDVCTVSALEDKQHRGVQGEAGIEMEMDCLLNGDTLSPAPSCSRTEVCV